MISASESTPCHPGEALDREGEVARPTIVAMRIPADGDPLHMIALPLVEATPEYHSGLYDSNLYHHLDVDGMRAAHRHCVDPLVPVPRGSAADADLFNDKTRDNSLGEKTGKPHLTFTHASLRLQPDVVDPFWKSTSEEAWNSRAFKRLHAGPPRSEADAEKMAGEYHIMYTLAVENGLRPNKHANLHVCGDAFVLKMASGKDEKGDLYYEDVSPRILCCSLAEHCLEALRCVQPATWNRVVGDRSYFVREEYSKHARRWPGYGPSMRSKFFESLRSQKPEL